MSRSKEALGEWIEKNKGNLIKQDTPPEEQKDTTLYDIIAIDKNTRKVMAVLVWKRIEGMERTQRLLERYNISLGCDKEDCELVCIPVLAGTAWTGKIINEL